MQTPKRPRKAPCDLVFAERGVSLGNFGGVGSAGARRLTSDGGRCKLNRRRRPERRRGTQAAERPTRGIQRTVPVCPKGRKRKSGN